MNSLKPHHDPLGLEEVSKAYERLQQPFGDIILFVLDSHLPRNFDRKVFGQWREAISAMREEGEDGTAKSAVITITSEDYPEGGLGDLSSIVSRLDKAKIDGFEIAVRRDDGEVAIKIARPHKTAPDVNEVVVQTGECVYALTA